MSLLETIEEGEWENRERQQQTGSAMIHKDSEEIDPLRRDRFKWMSFGKGYRLLVKDSAITCLPHGDGYLVFLVQHEGETFTLLQKEVPLETAMASAENYVCKNVSSFFYDTGARWRNEKASEKQLELLSKLGLPHDSVISKGEAANLLNLHFNQPATDKQVWYLNNYNLHPFPEALSKREAGKLIQKSKEESREIIQPF
jgi:hypothetical protein